MPLLRVGEPEGEVGIGEREGRLFAVELKVEAGSGGFDVGEAGGGAGSFLGGGSSLDAGGVQEDAFEIPLAVGEMDEVDAGFGEADGGELDAAAPKGAEAEGGADGVGADDGLVAEGGVFVDDKVLKREAGEREKVEGDFVEMHGAAEAVADAGGDAVLIAVDANVGRQQDEQHDCEDSEGEVEEATQRVGAEGRSGVVFGGVAGVEGALEGGISFLHECWSGAVGGSCRREPLI